MGARAPRAQWFKRETERRKWLTNLVKYFGVRVWQCHGFLEDLPDSVEALALGPIVEGSCHINLFGVVRPAMQIRETTVSDTLVTKGATIRGLGVAAAESLARAKASQS